MPEMLIYLKELTGIAEVKPFECVGTVDEVNAALHMFIGKNQHTKLPLLIDYYSNTTNYSPGNTRLAEKLITEFNTEHFLEPGFLDIIKQKIK